MRIGIVGAGIVGRLLAWHLIKQGVRCQLFEKATNEEQMGCSYIAAGMICPFSEAEFLSSDRVNSSEALHWWPLVVSSLELPTGYRQHGTLVVSALAHDTLLSHFIRTIYERTGCGVKLLSEKTISEHAPFLKNKVGCYIENEGSIEPKLLFKALAQYLQSNGVVWHWGTDVTHITEKTVQTQHRAYEFDCIVDCRGLGASKDLPSLRGIRGELIECYAPEVEIQPTLRFLHPRLSCYIVPRANHRFVIGATHIESESMAPLTVKSALDLLGAAVYVHEGFREAHILDMQANCRPAFKGNYPLVIFEKGVIRINGFFRHGFLLAPSFCHRVANHILGVKSVESHPE